VAADSRLKGFVGAERVAYLTRLLAYGAQLHCSEVAQMFGIRYQTAYRLLISVSRATPVYDEDHLWKMCPPNADEWEKLVNFYTSAE
jgi:hypothetical protein